MSGHAVPRAVAVFCGTASLLVTSGAWARPPTAGRVALHVEARLGEPVFESCRLTIWAVAATGTFAGLVSGVSEFAATVIQTADDDCAPRDTRVFAPDFSLDVIDSPEGLFGSFACAQGIASESGICTIRGDLNGVGDASIRLEAESLTLDVVFPLVTCPRCR